MGRRKQIEPQDIVWHMASWVESHERHPPTPMMSGCSTPPIRLWVCAFSEKCRNIAHTLDLTPPICYGGYSSAKSHA